MALGATYTPIGLDLRAGSLRTVQFSYANGVYELHAAASMELTVKEEEFSST